MGERLDFAKENEATFFIIYYRSACCLVSSVEVGVGGGVVSGFSSTNTVENGSSDWIGLVPSRERSGQGCSVYVE